MSVRRFRSVVFRLHKWLGLNLAIFFGIIFLSGTILMVADEIEATFHPKLWASPTAIGEQASFGTVYDSIRREFPASTIYLQLRQPQPWLADRAYVTTGWGEKIVVWSDPRTGAVRDVTQYQNFRAYLRALHDSMLVPKRLGFVLVTSTSFILLFLIIAGLITYRRFWHGLFRWPTRHLGARGYQSGWHRLIGVWSTVFLLMISVSGIYYLSTGLGFNGSTPRPQPAAERPLVRPANYDGQLIDQAEQRALAALPGFMPRIMISPRQRSDGIRFIGFTDRNGVVSGESSVSIDPVTLDVLGVVEPKDFRGNARLKPIMDALHFGIWGGVASRILWFFFGIASLYLLISGARVFVARAGHLSDAVAGQGGWRRFAGGLGLFNFAYLLIVLAMVALSVLRFGPPAAKWATLTPASDQIDGVQLRIFGSMRAGKDMRLALDVKQGVAQTLAVSSDLLSDAPVQLSPAEQGGRVEFQAVADKLDNRFVVSLIGPDGKPEQVTFNLGAAIW